MDVISASVLDVTPIVARLESSDVMAMYLQQRTFVVLDPCVLCFVQTVSNRTARAVIYVHAKIRHPTLLSYQSRYQHILQPNSQVKRQSKFQLKFQLSFLRNPGVHQKDATSVRAAHLDLHKIKMDAILVSVATHAVDLIQGDLLFNKHHSATSSTSEFLTPVVLLTLKQNCDCHYQV
jgi:hypothetical protein